jgi:hypothetical protein
MPVSILWVLRILALTGLIVFLFTSGRFHLYGESSLLGASGLGAISLLTASWKGAGQWEILFGKVLVVVVGVGLLGAGCAVLVVDCGVR